MRIKCCLNNTFFKFSRKSTWQRFCLYLFLLRRKVCKRKPDHWKPVPLTCFWVWYQPGEIWYQIEMPICDTYLWYKLRISTSYTNHSISSLMVTSDTNFCHLLNSSQSGPRYHQWYQLVIAACDTSLQYRRVISRWHQLVIIFLYYSGFWSWRGWWVQARLVGLVGHWPSGPLPARRVRLWLWLYSWWYIWW